ncbi:hypothetical protein ACSG6V_003646, partial [Vibrio cholerae]
MIFTALLTNTKKITLLFVWCFHISGWFSEHEKSASFTRCSRRLFPSTTKILEIIFSSFEMTALPTTKHLQTPFCSDAFGISILPVNARLRGWQRINTKLKYNNHNHRGSLGLETLRVDSPFEAFVN